MNLAKTVKEVSKKLNISGMELARRSGQSPQNLSKKLVKETLSFEEFEYLMELMGVQVELNCRLPGEEESSLLTYTRHAEDQLAILEKQLEVEQLKSKYFTDMSYEFRTALATVDGGLSLAMKYSDRPDRVREYLNKIAPSVQTLTKLMEDNPFNRAAGMTAFAQTSKAGNAAGTEAESGESVTEHSAAEKGNTLPATAGFVTVGNPNPESLWGRHVLLADDNDLNREIVREILELNRMTVTEAANGTEAVDLASGTGTYDFILMDLQMPKMDGFEAAIEIRGLKDRKKSEIPIIAMTAHVTEEDRTHAERVGMNAFIEKPLDMKKLGFVVNNLM